MLTMYGGIIAPPLIIGTVAGLTTGQIGMLVTAALFVSGCATLFHSEISAACLVSVMLNVVFNAVSAPRGKSATRQPD